MLWYALTKHWTSSNLIGIALSIQVRPTAAAFAPRALVLKLVRRGFKAFRWAATEWVPFCWCACVCPRCRTRAIHAPWQSGLFVYDVFWVFGTDVMVTVARSFDVPIKLLFPRALATADTDAQLSMLGLGDIVIPGACACHAMWHVLACVDLPAWVCARARAGVDLHAPPHALLCLAAQACSSPSCSALTPRKRAR